MALDLLKFDPWGDVMMADDLRPAPVLGKEVRLFTAVPSLLRFLPEDEKGGKSVFAAGIVAHGDPVGAPGKRIDECVRDDSAPSCTERLVGRQDVLSATFSSTTTKEHEVEAQRQKLARRINLPSWVVRGRRLAKNGDAGAAGVDEARIGDFGVAGDGRVDESILDNRESFSCASQHGADSQVVGASKRVDDLDLSKERERADAGVLDESGPSTRAALPARDVWNSGSFYPKDLTFYPSVHGDVWPGRIGGGVPVRHAVQSAETKVGGTTKKKAPRTLSAYQQKVGNKARLAAAEKSNKDNAASASTSSKGLVPSTASTCQPQVLGATHATGEVDLRLPRQDVPIVYPAANAFYSGALVSPSFKVPEYFLFFSDLRPADPMKPLRHKKNPHLAQIAELEKKTNDWFQRIHYKRSGRDEDIFAADPFAALVSAELKKSRQEAREARRQRLESHHLQQQMQFMQMLSDLGADISVEDVGLGQEVDMDVLEEQLAEGAIAFEYDAEEVQKVIASSRPVLTRAGHPHWEIADAMRGVGEAAKVVLATGGAESSNRLTAKGLHSTLEGLEFDICLRGGGPPLEEPAPGADETSGAEYEDRESSVFLRYRRRARKAKLLSKPRDPALCFLARVQEGAGVYQRGYAKGRREQAWYYSINVSIFTYDSWLADDSKK